MTSKTKKTWKMPAPRAVQLLAALKQDCRTSAQIMAKTGIPRGTIHTTMARMEKRGLIAVGRTWQHDGPRVVYSLTDCGHRMLEAVDTFNAARG